MTHDKFNEFVDETLSEVVMLLKDAKADEYAPDKEQDRLLDFKKAGALQGIDPKAALFGYLTKHLVSLANMVQSPIDDYQEAAKYYEKTGDAIAYLILLRAMALEEHETFNDAQTTEVTYIGTEAQTIDLNEEPNAPLADKFYELISSPYNWLEPKAFEAVTGCYENSKMNKLGRDELDGCTYLEMNEVFERYRKAWQDEMEGTASEED